MPLFLRSEFLPSFQQLAFTAKCLPMLGELKDEGR